MPSDLESFLRRHPRLFVLTGAGISADSGIPTYRDSEGQWQGRTPIQHQDFIRDPASRRRYWARSHAGWPPVASARPNAAHRALSELEQLGHIELLVTQNVDRLHQRAGSRSVIDLHGRLDRVVCLQCWHHSCRHELQDKLEASNGTPEPGTLRPDGDAEAEPASDDFCVPTCGHCGGTLMPDVVFFGGTVPRERVEQAMAALHRADALLAIGTSLQVFSGFRFCREAKKMGKAIALVNPGQTRADTMADIHIREDCGAVLADLVTSLQRPSAALHSHSPTHRPQPDR